MYGQIHCVIRELVQTKFGNEAWETILRKSQLDEHDSFLVFTRYDDVSTFSLVTAVSDTLDVPVEKVLEIFGEFFFDYCLRHGYDKMLRTLGSDMKSFIQNLDSLHSLLALSYKGISAPSFRCEDGPDGELILHYYSGRPGLYPIVKVSNHLHCTRNNAISAPVSSYRSHKENLSTMHELRSTGEDPIIIWNQDERVRLTVRNSPLLKSNSRASHIIISTDDYMVFFGNDGQITSVLKAVARDLFEQSVEMTVIEQNIEDIGCNQSQQHTAFRVFLRAGNTSKLSVSPEGSRSSVRTLTEFNPDKVLLRVADFCSAFPYHIIFDKELRIKQCGDLVQKHSSYTLTDGTLLTNAFSIVHPKMVVSIENIRKFINAVFLLAICPQENGKKTFLLKGQMIWLSETQHMIFIGSPRLTSLNELLEMNVYLADIPLYDVTRELVLLNQQRIAEIDIAKRLDETTAQLKKISHALEEEKSKTECLLHQMLPRNVAKALTNGQKVEAEKFDQVTILFSDIVTFTNIASACSPMDIVNLLNEIYQRFDARTSEHNVYKVETIGDAYMIVCGVPEKTAMHAQPVANFAMDMIEDAGLVRSPATGLPLQIRVGVHTGPVVAGVVGVKMPRYCLFGDTVNTASRMESHGVPGRIHISPTSYRALRGCGYIFKHRGQMEVKGKGVMRTYFLCGHLNRCLNDPQDEFTELQIHRDAGENADNSDISHSDISLQSNEHLGDQSTFVNLTKSVSNDNILLNPTNGSDIEVTACSRNYGNVNQHHVNSVSISDDNIFASSESLAHFDNSQRRISIKKSSLWLFNDNTQKSFNVPFLEGNSKCMETSVEAASTQSSSPDVKMLYDEDCACNDDAMQTEHNEVSCHGRQHELVPGPPATGEILRPHNLTIHSKNYPEVQTSTERCDCLVGNTLLHHYKPHSRNNTKKLDIRVVHDGLIHTTLTVTPTLSETSHHCASISKSETFPLASSCHQLKPACPPSRSQGTLALRTDTRSKKVKKHHSKLCNVA